MKIKRQKHAKKYLTFYRFNFGVREPYQVLLDGTFCQAALKNKIQIKEQLPKYLMGEVQLCTSHCVIKELESLGKELYGAKLIAQRFQDQELAAKVKKRAGVPLMFIIQNTIVLDKPSPKSLARVEALQSNQLVPEHQKHSIKHLKHEQGVAKDSERKGRKRKRLKGPNPLSCMKKKKKIPQQQAVASTSSQTKRKRRRKNGKSAGSESMAGSG